MPKPKARLGKATEFPGETISTLRIINIMNVHHILFAFIAF